MTQAPTPGPLHDSDCSHDGYEVDTADQPIRCAECGQSLSPTAPVEASGSERLWPVGSWLSAALDDPKVCEAMKADIREWFDNGGHLRPQPSGETREVETEVQYEVWGAGPQGDFCAASDTLSDAQHYAAVYGQDGPVVINALSTTPARAESPSGDLRTACKAVLDDYQTSDAHHPDHVLIRRTDFDRIKALVEAPVVARAEAPDEEAATDDLVDRFAVALKAKLRAAGEKYGFDDAWKADDWRDKLIEDLLRHIQKGDPRDVAAYCAFAWHHDWSLSPKQDDLRSAAFTDRGAEDRYVSQDEGAAGEPEWVVNDIAELGVKIGERFYWLYKGQSLVYGQHGDDVKDGVVQHEDGGNMHWRPVFKREFGECCHPVNYADPTRIGTVSLDDSDDWKPLPAAHPSPTPAADEDRVRSVACLTRYSPLSTGNNKAMMQEDEAGLYVLRKQALAALKSTAAKEGG